MKLISVIGTVLPLVACGKPVDSLVILKNMCDSISPFFFIFSIIGAHVSLSKANEMSAADKFYQLEKSSAFGPSIWAFGKSGVNVYSVDGTKVLMSHSNMDICGAEDCQFRHAVSDGKRYVYATNNAQGTVDVFSIDNGEMMASLDTCGSPWSLDYHPRREELWVHCWGPKESDGDTGHVDVFSTSSVHSPMSQVKLPPALVGHAHGTVVVDSSLGHVGYGTDLNTPSLFKIDLNKRIHTASYDLPKINGLYRMVYSKVNRHLYMRAYICCSCGFEEADLATCGRGGSRPVNVTTGPNQGINLDGTCGHGCEGSVADTIGVYEFDTVQNIRVANWQMSDGFGADPYVSPEGDYIALFGNNGGGTVRLMKPGRNGGISKLWADVKVGLNEPDTDPSAKSISDATFIKHSNHNMVIFTSTLSNSVALVDLSKDTPVVRKLLLTDKTEITSNHGTSSLISFTVYSIPYTVAYSYSNLLNT